MENENAVRDALAALAVDGRLTPDAVVEAAADPDSPLHCHFTWDDEEAAALYRVEQARMLIRSVRVDLKIGQAVVRTVAYVRDPQVDRAEQGYIAVDVLKQDQDLAREAVANEFIRAGAALRRAKLVAASLELPDDIDELAARTDALLNWAQAPQPQV
jgi:hypothetical protein